MPDRIPTAAVLRGHDIRGRRHDVRVCIRHILPLADRIYDTVRGQRHRMRVTVPAAGDADVVAEARANPRGGSGEEMAGRGPSGRRHCPCCHSQRSRGHRRTGGRNPYRLEVTYGTDRVEADAVDVLVFRVPAGQRLLRAAVLLGGRAEEQPRAVGRIHGHRIPVRVPGHR